MVPVELLMLEDEVRDDGEHHEGDALLDNLQLHEVKGTAVIDKAQTVGRHLAAVLEEGNALREYDDTQQRPVRADARL